MQAAADRFDFAPPPPPGRAVSIGLAVLAHLLLAAALTWGIRWNKDEMQVTAQAELWAPTMQEAAPAPVEAPPPPPPAPVIQPAPKPQVAPPPPAPSKADIALEREKKRQAEEKKKQEAEQKKKEAEKARKLEEDKRKKALAEKQREDERRKREEAEKARAKAEAADAKRMEAQRQENLRRIQGLAGATGAPSAAGNAQRSAGPSDSYAGRIRAKVKPNIVFTEDAPGNPITEVEVRMAPDGTITSRKITKASGVKAWDEAVLRALDRTEVLPRDVDGRVHSPLVMAFRLKD